MIHDPTLDVSQYLFHHDRIDLIWTTGGPKAVAAANAAGKPSLSHQRQEHLHQADIGMAVVDMLISKTFDASVICPAEQTCVVDEAIYDDLVAEFERLGGQLLEPDQVDALADLAFEPDGRSTLALSGVLRQPRGDGRLRGGGRGQGPARSAALRSRRARRAPLIQEKLMPVLGLVRSPSVDHGVSACELITEHGGLGHTSAVYAHDDSVIDHFASRVRTGRILVNAPTAVGASAGSTTRSPRPSRSAAAPGGLEHHRQRQLQEPAQREDRLAPPGASPVVPRPVRHLLQRGRDREPPRCRGGEGPPGHRHRRRGARGGRRGEPLPRGPERARLLRPPPEPSEAQIQAGTEVLGEFDADCIVAVGGGSVLDAGKAMRLFHESPDVSLRELALPFLDARKRVAHYPEVEHTVRLLALPTTARTGSESRRRR